MFELLWLLLPVAAFSGWWIGRRGPRGERDDDSFGAVPEAYFQGLNYLLNEERDKALDLFTRMVEVDSDTVETHLALGSLFRRRGEVDRAIRIHQNLIARPTLTRRQRTYALLALGEDYMKAGLFDRAEKLLTEVVSHKTHAEQALRHLVTIYEREKEWGKAMDAALHLQRLEGGGYTVRIAQFHCEQAQEAMAAADTNRARSLLRQALSHDPACVRASLLTGDLERGLGRHRVALKAYHQIARQDRAFVPEALDGLEASYRALGKPGQLEAYLRDLAGQYPAGPVVTRLADLIRERLGTEQAIDELSRLLRHNPTLVGIRRLVDLTRSVGEPIGPAELDILLELFDHLEMGKPHYRCQACGFSGRALFWQCPGCKSWASMRPAAEKEPA